MLRLERHPFRTTGLRPSPPDPRVPPGARGPGRPRRGRVLRRRRPRLATTLAAVVGVWLVAKDWRDLVPSKRDSASWQLGLHRRATPLRGLRRSDSLPTLAALAAPHGWDRQPRLRSDPELRLATPVPAEERRVARGNPVFHALAVPARGCPDRDRVLPLPAAPRRTQRCGRARCSRSACSTS